MGQPDPSRDAEVQALRARVAELERADAERQRAENDLRQLNAMLSALLENTDDFVLFADRSGSPLFFNSAYARVMGELLGIEMRPGLKPHELLPEAEARAVWDEYHRRALTGEKFTIEYAHPLGEGKLRHFEVRYNPVRQEGEIVGFSEFTSDVTAHKLIEQALRESNERLERLAAERTTRLRTTESRYRAITEHTADIISILDRDWRFTYTAPSVRRHGFEPEQVVGGHARDFAHPDDYPAVEAAIRHAIEHPGQPASIDVFRVLEGSGEYTELEGQFTCLFGVPGIDGIVFNGRDISERRRLEERLRHSEKMDAIGQLAGGIAHDFNNQLTGILANADLLRLKLGPSPLAAVAGQIAEAARRSADLTRKLLSFARKGPIQRIPSDVNAMLAELAELLRRSVDKRIAIEVQPCNPVCVAVGDPTMIHNAVLNLALNARDAMPEGGMLRLRSNLVTFDDGNPARRRLGLPPGRYVNISVIDDGVGMDAETQRRMFEPFFTTKSAEKGTGMGLASVYGTARSHGGAVAVTSARGRGTTVDLYLPAGEHADVQSSDERRQDADRGLRILVVDDELTLRSVLADLLTTLGHQVVTCADGAEAIELYRRDPHAVDLVVLDLIMPRMNGRDTLLALRAVDPGVRALVMSGYSEEGMAQQLLDEGARGFLLKPFDVKGIARAIHLARRDRSPT